MTAKTTERENGHASTEIMTQDEQAIQVVPTSIDLTQAIQTASSLGKEGEGVLERLELMMERQNARSAVQLFNTAVAELHARIGSVTKNRTANFKTRSGASVSYRYADLHQVANALRDAGAGNLGLSWSWDTEYADGAQVVTCTLSHSAGHSRKGSWRAPIEDGNPMTSAPQKAKIATTFGQRVTLIQVFGLTDTEDDVDGQMPARQYARVSADEALTLEARTREAAEAKGKDPGAVLKQMLSWAGVGSVEDFPRNRYEAALGKLGGWIQ